MTLPIETTPVYSQSPPIPETMLRDPPPIPVTLAIRIEQAIERAINSEDPLQVSERQLRPTEVIVEEAGLLCNLAKLICLTGMGTGLSAAASQLTLPIAVTGGSLISLMGTSAIFCGERTYPLLSRYQ